MSASDDPGFPVFRPRPPWWGGDLQTLRNILARITVDLSAWPAETLSFDLGDGDKLTGALHRPAGSASDPPVVVVIHGLTGCEDSIHVRVSARHYLESGYAVLRLNLRGSAPTRPDCGGFYHAGRTEDIAAVFDWLGSFPAILAVGYSLGGNVLLNYLGERGAESKVDAAVAVSVPIDLSATSKKMRGWRNRVYHDYMLARMKAEALAPGAVLAAGEREAVESASSVFEFDDRFIAQRFGFDGAEDYYAQCGARRFLGEAERPALLIHALDDPWIPAAAYWEIEPRKFTSLRLLLTRSGGHVGFHGTGDPVPWHDRCAVRFFDSVTG